MILTGFKFWPLVRYLPSVSKTIFKQIIFFYPGHARTHAHTHTQTHTHTHTHIPFQRQLHVLPEEVLWSGNFLSLEFWRHAFRISVLRPVALTDTLFGFFQTLQKIPGNYLKLGHDGLSPDSLQFMVHTSDPAQNCLQIASLNKPQIHTASRLDEEELLLIRIWKVPRRNFGPAIILVACLRHFGKCFVTAAFCDILPS